ncbi:hydrogenase maturation nickel metallochaperone HypA [Vibrio sp. vnigr-6D03]|nr:hydrogenase maturation nickel metallochaperone HypA [Vibrio sp. vnigr-6D03]
MHEMSICESIVQTLDQQAQQQSFSRVKTVCLEIGQLASVEIDALTFCFDVVANDTIAHGAELVIERVAGSAWCEPCQRTVALEARYSPCQYCGSFGLLLTGGDEMRIKEVEVN